MLYFKNSSLIFLLALTFSQIYLSTANNAPNAAKKVVCERNPGDGPGQMCTMELNPVCAYHNNTDKGTSVGNPCGACHQELYDYYYLGACEGDEIQTVTEPDLGPPITPCVRSETPSVGSDGPTDVGACAEIYKPVCAYYNEDADRKEGKTIENGCAACQWNNFDYYIDGECPAPEPQEPSDEINQCPDLSATDYACTYEYLPVCAYHSNDTNRTNGVSIGNACQACTIEGYNFYVNGTCPNPEPIRCNTTGTVFGAVDCTAIYDPICGYFDNDTNRENGKTSQNACNGCFYEFWDYYLPGPCPGDEVQEEEEQPLNPTDPVVERCDTNVPQDIDACDSSYVPVCAYKDSDPNSGHTVSSDCVACNQQGYDFYTRGECSAPAGC